MEKPFSLVRAIRNAANNVPQDELTQAVLSAGRKDFADRSLEVVGQIQLPLEERAITYTTEHDDIVVTNVYSPLPYLRAKNVLALAGATIIDGAKGDIQIPVLGSDITCTWESETAETSANTPSFSSVKLTPKRMSTVVEISRQLIEQDSIGIEAFIQQQISEAISAKLEETVFDASNAGSTTKPGSITYDASGLTDASTYAGICNIEATAEESGFYNNLKWVVSPRAKAKLRTLTKGASTAAPVYDNGEIDGTPVISTGHLKNNVAVYGDWSQLNIVSWNNIQVTVDPLTLAASGKIRLVVNWYVDVKPSRANAFKPCKIV